MLSDPLSKLNHRHLITSVSTNSELIADIETGKLDSDKVHLLTAKTQSGGRGQHERSWQSPLGNVYLSVYHPYQAPISGLLSLIVGVKLAGMPVIETMNKQLCAKGLIPIGVKWANDLGFYAKQTVDISVDIPIIPFSKLAGILIEPVLRDGKILGVVIGVGLNVATTPTLTVQTAEGMSYQAISLQDIKQLIEADNDNNELPNLATLYEQVSDALLSAMTCFAQIALEHACVHPYYLHDFRQQFEAVDALVGLKVCVTQTRHDQDYRIVGHACGIDTDGCLQLRQDDASICTIFTGRIDVLSRD
ncbi:biotin--[acetyl-CoA-carboxylase] ligase [Psychrobacter sp. DM4]|uniref:biotin--[acetyl-CoA-carboxylase] ligase n=1 Tax=Psychrobacter sp. DM4 TaxID=3440637 RepID=UPI003F50AA22